MKKPEEFGEVIVRSNGPDDVVKVKDVGRVEMGLESYNDAILRFNGKESVGIGILPLPKANILEVASGVLAELELMKSKFPPGLTYRNAFSNADPVNASIREVLTTLFEAILLVVLVMFLFLQSVRITLIPLITIPVSLIGTATGLYVLGYSMNTLTLFGITLATGLVVDDAIVVIENIERVLHENGSSVIDAAKESLREIASAVIATTLVLGAVFIPVTFLPGNDRASLQTVCRYDRDLGRHFGVYRSYAYTGAFRSADERKSARHPLARLVQYRARMGAS